MFTAIFTTGAWFTAIFTTGAWFTAIFTTTSTACPGPKDRLAFDAPRRHRI
jgi:hypothetical protein